MASPIDSRRRRHRCAALALVCALSLPAATPAQGAMDDMFGVMFRMMMVMMNTMSGAMLGNNSTSNWGNNLGGFNSFNMGMSAFPMMSGFGSPWSSFGSPWNSYGQNPWGMSPWGSGSRYPYAGGRYPGEYGSHYGNYGYPAMHGAPGYRNEIPAPYSTTSILDGRWFGNSGEILEIRGDRFILQTTGARLAGKLSIAGNIVNLYSPQTNTVTRYTFLRNQSELLLNSGSGTVLTFRKHPAGGAAHLF